MTTTVSFAIPDNKVAKYVAAVLYQFPNVEKDVNGNALFTDPQWAKEVVRRYVVNIGFAYDRHLAQVASVDTVVKDDTTLIT